MHFNILLIIYRNRSNRTTITHISHTTYFSAFLFSGILPLIKKMRARNIAELSSNVCLTMTVNIKKMENYNVYISHTTGYSDVLFVFPRRLQITSSCYKSFRVLTQCYWYAGMSHSLKYWKQLNYTNQSIRTSFFSLLNILVY